MDHMSRYHAIKPKKRKKKAFWTKCDRDNSPKVHMLFIFLTKRHPTALKTTPPSVFFLAKLSNSVQIVSNFLFCIEFLISTSTIYYQSIITTISYNCVDKWEWNKCAIYKKGFWFVFCFMWRKWDIFKET